MCNTPPLLPLSQTSSSAIPDLISMVIHTFCREKEGVLVHTSHFLAKQRIFQIFCARFAHIPRAFESGKRPSPPGWGSARNGLPPALSCPPPRSRCRCPRSGPRCLWAWGSCPARPPQRRPARLPRCGPSWAESLRRNWPAWGAGAWAHGRFKCSQHTKKSPEVHSKYFHDKFF